ncbi:ABC transporter permease subunit [Cohnella sp. CFH 77786]|uniref:carbohydrate ABC transporter permease n=1 Tax=Cohnella sp. CFH 77786 TaxID=2662265 RepID=UPI001C60FE1D|nr:carbohydrate ABC transporter permease [Cohnella sp. CFH 77786]MBW5447055.1 ABC transporter permease subunit [Cohnella sp. CFH 77786]
MKSKLQGFDYANMFVLILISIVCVYPLWNIFAVSLSDGIYAAASKVYLVPKGFNVETYKYVLNNPRLGVADGLLNSFLYTVVGTLVAVIMTFITAYPLSKKRLAGRKLIMLVFMFTFIFEAGIIPNYIVYHGVGLVNSFWVMVIPGAINTFLLIIMRSFLDALPEELEESAHIDGANDLQIMWRIYFPLTRPAIATVCVFYSVSIWNQFLIPAIYLQKQSLKPITLVLYNLIISAGKDGTSLESINVNGVQLLPQNLQAAAVFLAVAPILIVYPFAQKYFTKGMLIGSVKG